MSHDLISQSSSTTLYNAQGQEHTPRPSFERAVTLSEWCILPLQQRREIPLILEVQDALFERALTDPSVLSDLVSPWISLERSRFTDGRVESSIVSLRRARYRGEIYVTGEIPPDGVTALLRVGATATTTPPLNKSSSESYGVAPPWLYRRLIN